MTTRLLLVAVLVALAVVTVSCSRPQPPAAASPVFAPVDYFVGEMHSSGELKIFMRPPTRFRVDSVGRKLTDGSMRLDQTIHWAGRAADHRFWLMRPRPGGGYAVSLSDAQGLVLFETQGARAHLRYRDKRGSGAPLTIEQWMDLQPDGRTLANRGTVSVLGAPIAHLDETIIHDPR